MEPALMSIRREILFLVSLFFWISTTARAAAADGILRFALTPDKETAAEVTMTGPAARALYDFLSARFKVSSEVFGTSVHNRQIRCNKLFEVQDPVGGLYQCQIVLDKEGFPVLYHRR